MDWNDPEERAALIERVGPQRYNALQARELNAATIVRVNGFAIREVGSQFGRLFAVDGTNSAFKTLAEAKAFAEKQPH
jgi:hypothetical protein